MFSSYFLFFVLLLSSHLFTGGRGAGRKTKAAKTKNKKKKTTKKTGTKPKNKKKGKTSKGFGVPGLPRGPTMGKVGKGAKIAGKGGKLGIKGVKGVAKGVKAGVVAGLEAKRGLSRGSNDSSSIADMDWKKRTQTDLEEQPDFPSIRTLPMPPVDISFQRPRLARKSREINDQLRKDWKYLIDEDGDIRFKTGRFGAKFLLPVGFPPAE